LIRRIAEYGGRIVKNTGDGFLTEFARVVDAVRCVVEAPRVSEIATILTAGQESRKIAISGSPKGVTSDERD
jgi:class 3 adenylate cyclase